MLAFLIESCFPYRKKDELQDKIAALRIITCRVENF
jgi:hypothetical protein